MDKLLKRYVIPLGILILGSFCIDFLTRYSPLGLFKNAYYLLVVIMLFSFGMSLNNQKSKLKNFSIRHLIIVILVMLLYFFDTGIIHVALFEWFLTFTVADVLILKLFYVYLGWLFIER